MKRAFTTLAALVAVTVGFGLLAAGCKKKPETTEEMQKAELVAPEDLSKATWLTEEQRNSISMRRATGGPRECSGEGLRATLDPDLTYAKCFYYERKDYGLKAYRDRFAATPEARFQSCFDHAWVGKKDATPPTDRDYTVAIQHICTMDLGEDTDAFDRLTAKRRH